MQVSRDEDSYEYSFDEFASQCDQLGLSSIHNKSKRILKCSGSSHDSGTVDDSWEGQRRWWSSFHPCCVAVCLESPRCDGFVCASSPWTTTQEEHAIVSWQVCSGGNGKRMHLRMMTFEWCIAAPWRYCNCQMLTLTWCCNRNCWCVTI